MARGTGSRRPPFEATSVSGEAAVATEGKSRRDLLKALGAAAAGAVAGGVLKAEDAEASHGLVNGTSDNDFRPGVHGVNHSQTGVGVEGSATFEPGGFGAGGAGVVGRGDVGVGGVGRSVGVYAASSQGEGVQVEGIGDGMDVGVSVRDARVGVSARGDDVGVLASSSKTALRVMGQADFSTAGSSTISTGQDSAAVSNSRVTGLSHITVTLTGDPGQASSAPGNKPVVVWVERQPGTGFVVHLSRPVRFATPFTYLIVEPV
jgi:hypothetical protein